MLQVKIEFFNFNNKKDNIKLSLKRETLIEKSRYFNSMLNNDFLEKKKEIIDIDLTTYNFYFDKEVIKIFFEIALSENYEPVLNKNNNKNFQIIMKAPKNSYKYKLDMDLGFSKKVQIHHYYMLIFLNEFFSFDLDRLIEQGLILYKEIVGLILNDFCELDNLNHYNLNYLDHDPIYNDLDYYFVSDFKQIKKKLIDTFDEQITLYFRDIIDIDKELFEQDLQILRQIVIVNNFLKNIFQIRKAYEILKDNTFNGIVLYINKYLLANKNINTIHFNYKISELRLDDSIIKMLDLNEMDDFIKSAGVLIKNKNECTLKLYDYYDIMFYEFPKWKKFEVIDNNYNYNYNHKYEIGVSTIKNKETTVEFFKKETNNMFNNFNWANVILSGGFLYGLINNLNNSLNDSSDIDLFVYGANDSIINDKVLYIIKYFQEYNPYYIVRGQVINIVIPDFKYDIQIIFFGNHKTPQQIISTFDFNYVSMYYNGNEVYCTFDCLIGLKYSMAILNLKNVLKSKLEFRLFKSILKGLHIKYTKKINCKMIKNEKIYMDKISNDVNEVNYMNKSKFLRKIINYCDEKELQFIINAYYKTNLVYRNHEDILINKNYITKKINFNKDTDEDSGSDSVFSSDSDNENDKINNSVKKKCNNGERKVYEYTEYW